MDLLRRLDYDLIAGVPYAALPVSGAIAWQMGQAMIYPRKEAKTHGTGRQIEGAFSPGQRAVLVEDVITSGGTILAAAETLRGAGLIVEEAVVAVDRKQGGVAALAEQGLHVHPVLDIYQIISVLKSSGRIDSATHKTLMEYLDHA